VNIDLYNLSPGPHGLHIHFNGDLGPTLVTKVQDGQTVISSLTYDGLNADLHFNPFTWDHACYPNARHVGDLTTIYVAQNGSIALSFHRDLITLSGFQSVLGRSLLVHALVDDCTKQATGSGHAGDRQALGVIGLNPSVNNTASAGPGISACNVRLNPVYGVVGVTGDIYLRQVNQSTTIYARIVNLTAGVSYGISIRTYGDITNLGDENGQDVLQSNMGPVFDITGNPHGLPTETHKTGDLGNVVASIDGQVYFVQSYTGLALADIVARGFVLHKNQDLGSASSSSDGGVGEFQSVGVVGITNLNYYPAVVLDHYSGTNILSVSYTLLLMLLAAIGFFV